MRVLWEVNTGGVRHSHTHPGHNRCKTSCTNPRPLSHTAFARLFIYVALHT